MTSAAPPPGAVAVPAGQTMDALFTAQARLTPQAVAVRQWDAVLTYQELLDAAAGLAGRLRAAGAGPEQCVGVCAGRSPAMVAAVLGVLLSGAAYVPLDPGHPPGRLRSVLADARARLVVADDAGQELLSGAACRFLDLPRLRPAVGRPAGPPPPPAARPGNAAYVLYTSGSTGRPKGVVVSHANLTAFVTQTAAGFGLGPSCRSIGFASLAFDASIIDIFIPLSCGGSVQLMSEADRAGPAQMQRFLHAHEATWGILPPALLPLLDPDGLPALTDLITGGEAPGPEQVARWARPGLRRFHNRYGPTEAAVAVAGGEFSGQWHEPLPIGVPLPGCQVHVLDEHLRPCPPGTPGELYAGGPQVARGYLGQPGLTAAAFVPDPFSGEPGARLYRTGDAAMWRPDGMLAYLGRLDRQVKINGQRVEIGEIEAVLAAHPRVQQAAVEVAGGAAGSKLLIAYLSPAGAPDLDEVRAHCRRRLPAYMTPARVVRLPALPLNSSGKVDLPALRAQAAAVPGPRAPRDAPPPEPGGKVAGDLLAAVSRAWAEVLGSAPGPRDGFVAAGGDSIVAMKLAATLHAHAGRVIDAADVFAARTPAGLAELLAVAPASGADVPACSPPELSPAQRRIWFVEQFAPAATAHNIALAQRLRGDLDTGALRRALRDVARRQEALRWRVRADDGVPAAILAPAADVPLPVDDLSPLPPAQREEALRRALTAEARGAFDLAAGPLWRARLLRLGPQEHVLAITVHHIVFDGTSVGVLYRELSRCYRGAAAAPLPATFADYVARLRRRSQADAGGPAWWAEHLAGAPTVLDLPRDRARPPVQTFRGASREARVDPAVTGRLRELAAGADTTLYAALLAAFGHLLGRLAGVDDLVVGTPLADRRHPAFGEVAGLLLHMVPLRLRLDGDPAFTGLLRRCRDEAAAAFAHAELPLERIVETLGGSRDLSRNPLIQVLFNMYNFAGGELALPGVTAEPAAAGLPGSLFDLTLYASDDGDGVALTAVYNPDLYDAERIDALLASYLELLRQCARTPDLPLSAAGLRPPASRLPDWADPLPAWDGPGLVERVRVAARRRPGEVAVSGAGGTLTYREVDDLATQTAAAVRAAGLARADVAAVIATRDIRLAPALLGVLASGARWLIADPALPGPVLARQREAAQPKALLCPQPGTAVPDPLADLPVITVPAPPGRRSGGQAGGGDVPAEERGYLLLTSGTTGQPNLVITPERPLAHFADWYPSAFGLGPEDRFAMLAGLAHDPLLRDALVPLAIGARLCVPAAEVLRDPAELLNWLAGERVTVAHLTPQLARLLVSAPGAGPGAAPALRLVVLGGDQPAAADVAALRSLAPGARVVTFYGATETPQAHAWHEPGREPVDPLPAGRGAGGSALLVLGVGGQPAAVGELGEVVVRSRHLAAGYADAELTLQRFAPSPGGDPQDRFFRTGDLGRHRPDGAVALAGRADRQVKIRGFRVEPGEVEAALAGLPQVRQACVLAEVDAGGPCLHAYVVPARPGIQPAGLLAGLRQRLPAPAVPAGLTLLAQLPLTPNGKVDAAALRRAAAAARPAPAVAAPGLSGPTEQIVAGVWREVLGLPSIGPQDNFFDIGGHSLALAAVQAKLAQRLSRPVSVLDLFRMPTIRSLAAHLDGEQIDPMFERATQRAAQRRVRARRPAAPPGLPSHP